MMQLAENKTFMFAPIAWATANMPHLPPHGGITI